MIGRRIAAWFAGLVVAPLAVGGLARAQGPVPATGAAANQMAGLNRQVTSEGRTIWKSFDPNGKLRQFEGLADGGSSEFSVPKQPKSSGALASALAAGDADVVVFLDNWDPTSADDQFGFSAARSSRGDSLAQELLAAPLQTRRGLQRLPSVPALIGRLTANPVELLKQDPRIARIELAAVTISPTYSASARTVHADGLPSFYCGGWPPRFCPYTGAGQRIAVFERGTTAPNPFLSGTTNVIGSSTDEHATAVVGVMRNSSVDYGPGVSPGASIDSFGMGSPPNYLDVTNMFNAAVAAGDRIWNFSWSEIGYVRQIGPYGQLADQFAFDQAVTIVAAAGNISNNIGDAGTVSPCNGYNIICVGGFYDFVDSTWTNDVVDTDSAFGNPIGTTSDREKPTLVAPSVNVQSIQNGGTNSVSGTSFASPHVAAAAADLFQMNSAFSTSPEMVRATLVATAIHNIEGSVRQSDIDGAGAVAVREAASVALATAGGASAVTLPASCPPNGTAVYLGTIAVPAGKHARIAIAFASDPSYANYLTAPSEDIDLIIYRKFANGTRAFDRGSFSWNDTNEVVDWVETSGASFDIEISHVRCDRSAKRLGLAWWVGAP